MTLVDVAGAVDSTDCDWPGCDREAERDGRCRYHAGRAPVARPGGEPREERPAHEDAGGRIVPGALAHLMEDDPLETQVADGRVHPGYLAADPEPKETPVATGTSTWTRDKCIDAVNAFHAEHGRTPRQPEMGAANGLPTNASIRSYFGGMTAFFAAAGLQGPGRGRAGRSRGPTSGAPAVKPPPVAEPAASNGHAPLTLTQLAQAVDQAADDLAAARLTHETALNSLRAALDTAA